MKRSHKRTATVLFLFYLAVVLRITVFRSSFTLQNLCQNGKIILTHFEGDADLAGRGDWFAFTCLFVGNIVFHGAGRSGSEYDWRVVWRSAGGGGQTLRTVVADTKMSIIQCYFFTAAFTSSIIGRRNSSFIPGISSISLGGFASSAVSSEKPLCSRPISICVSV